MGARAGGRGLGGGLPSPGSLSPLLLSLLAQCPVYDLDNNVAFIGMYQTMTKKAAITVQVGQELGRGHRSRADMTCRASPLFSVSGGIN